MKTFAAVAISALVTGGTAWATIGNTIILHPADEARVAGTGIECVDYPAKAGSALACAKAGSSNTFVTMDGSAIAVTKNLSASLYSSTQEIEKQLAAGNVDLVTNWSSTSQIGSKLADETKQIASLTTRLSAAQQQLATANVQLVTVKTELAAAQASAVVALEGQGLPALMKTALPQLGQWFGTQQGADFTQFTDPGTGYADYDFKCDSCTSP